jgi:site-specific DNA-methyltransferase (adenine-specific)
VRAATASARATSPASEARDRPFAELSLGAPGRSVRLYRTDVLEGFARHVAPGSVDVVVTSPPYNLGIRYAASDDARPRVEYLDWIGAVGRSVARALAPRGSFFLNVGGPPRDPTLPWEIAARIQRSLVLQNVIHWVKSIAIDREAVGRAHALTADLTVGHYKPIQSPRYLHGAHEYIFHFSHDGEVRLDRLAVGVAYQDSSNVERWRGASGGVRCRGNTWFLPYATIRRQKTDRPHPATFPPELPDRCLRLHGVDHIHLAVDPFVGIGSSAIAAARLGIPFVGFDIASEYLSEAERRLRKDVGRPAAAPRHGPASARDRP